MNKTNLACGCGGALVATLLTVLVLREGGAATEPFSVTPLLQMPRGKFSIHGRIAKGASGCRLLMNIPGCQQNPLVEIVVDLERPLYTLDDGDISFKTGTMQVLLLRATEKARAD